MAIPTQIMSVAAGLMNDALRTRYTDAVVLPYFNLAIQELQEIYELNSIPVTHKTSALINVPAGVSAIGYNTVPPLPSDLIEIIQLWESVEGQNKWTPMLKDGFIPEYLNDGTGISSFGMWAWKNNQIELLAANADNDIKIDYIATVFVLPITIGDVNLDIPVRNIQTYLEYKTASLCAIFVAKDAEASIALNLAGESALSRALGVPIKGMQTNPVRRRPFRASYKSRGRY